MSDETFQFQVGDRVKIEGVLEYNCSFNNEYPLAFWIGDRRLTFTLDGKYTQADKGTLQLVERPKPKVAEYKVLYEDTVP